MFSSNGHGIDFISGREWVSVFACVRVRYRQTERDTHRDRDAIWCTQMFEGPSHDQLLSLTLQTTSRLQLSHSVVLFRTSFRHIPSGMNCEI